MNRAEILELIKTLAKSQGFYGRLLNEINNMSDYEKMLFFDALETKHFSSDLDVIMYLEGN